MERFASTREEKTCTKANGERTPAETVLNVTEKMRKESKESEINRLTRGANYTDILAVSPLDGASPLAGNIATAAKGNNTAVFHLGNMLPLVELNAIAAFR